MVSMSSESSRLSMSEMPESREVGGCGQRVGAWSRTAWTSSCSTRRSGVGVPVGSSTGHPASGF